MTHDALARLFATPALSSFSLGEVLRADATGWLAAARAPRGEVVRVRIFPETPPEALARWRDVMTRRVMTSHPALERVLSHGDAAGHPFVVLESVAGPTLDDHRQNRTLAPAPALSLIFRVLTALGEVHARGLVHGALTPRTVIVTTAGAVQLTEAALAPPSHVATPYSAPEQRIGPATPASDLYAIGLLLHELLTGTLPKRVSANEPTAPAAPDSVMLPPYLGMALARLLAARPEARPPTAAEAKDLLVPPKAKVGWGEQGVFAPPLTQDELTGRTRSHPASIAVVIVCLIIIAVCYAMFLANPARGDASPPPAPALIPRPAALTLTDGAFPLGSARRIVLDPDEPPIRAAGERLAALLARTGRSVPLATATTPAEFDLVLTAPAAGPLTDESHALTITPTTTLVTAGSPAGLTRALATLDQLTPADATAWPALALTDRPRFAWRGVLVDVARHFRSAAWMKKLLDAMALHKLNVLHWHLTDDQGWRVPIRSRPKLVTAPAYTVEEVRDVLAHARSLHIEVIPEIDMPGHVSAALSAYPELSCSGAALPVPTTWGTFEHVLCVGNEASFAFAEDVLREIAELFPNRRVHLGGDEVPRRRWEECKKCQARIASARLRGADELQAYFLGRAIESLRRRGRTAIVWDDDAKHGFPADTVVHAWHGESTAAQALRAGHALIASPPDRAYFDRSALHLPLARVLALEPAPRSASDAEAARVLGAEACLWSERVITDEDAERRLFPRLTAFAEALWSPPPAATDFAQRLIPHEKRLAALGLALGHAGVRAGLLSPMQLAREFRTLKLDVTDHLTAPGTYRVALGEDAPVPVELRAVRLKLDGAVRAEATRVTSTATELPERVYELAIPDAPRGTWTLELEARNAGRGAAFASVWLERDVSTIR
jgi:hypothetical protein